MSADQPPAKAADMSMTIGLLEYLKLTEHTRQRDDAWAEIERLNEQRAVIADANNNLRLSKDALKMQIEVLLTECNDLHAQCGGMQMEIKELREGLEIAKANSWEAREFK